MAPRSRGKKIPAFLRLAGLAGLVLIVLVARAQVGLAHATHVRAATLDPSMLAFPNWVQVRWILLTFLLVSLTFLLRSLAAKAPRDAGSVGGEAGNQVGEPDLTHDRSLTGNRNEAGFLGRRKNPDLLSIPLVRSLLSSRRFKHLLQWSGILVLTVMVVLGFLGTQESGKSLTYTFTWFIWWPLFFVMIVLAGRVWCLICPFAAIADRAKRAFPFHRPAPGSRYPVCPCRGLQPVFQRGQFEG